jgi:hypothetical protein
MVITVEQSADRIRLIAIEMKGAFGNEGALPRFKGHTVALHSLFENGIETGQQVRNGFFGLVAHVG